MEIYTLYADERIASVNSPIQMEKQVEEQGARGNKSSSSSSSSSVSGSSSSGINIRPIFFSNLV